MGIILIVSGAVLVERNTQNAKINSGRISKKSMILPLLAAMFLGWAYIIRKMGLNIYDEPIMGACLSYIAALSLYALLPRLSTYVKRSLSFNMKNLRLFWKSGVCICAAWFCAYYAIRYGDVAVVSPIVDTEPLFIALLAYVYLKDLETISLKLAAGTFIIVLGVSFITMF